MAGLGVQTCRAGGQCLISALICGAAFHGLCWRGNEVSQLLEHGEGRGVWIPISLSWVFSLDVLNAGAEGMHSLLVCTGGALQLVIFSFLLTSAAKHDATRWEWNVHFRRAGSWAAACRWSWVMWAALRCYLQTDFGLLKSVCRSCSSWKLLKCGLQFVHLLFSAHLCLRIEFAGFGVWFFSWFFFPFITKACSFGKHHWANALNCNIAVH